MDRGYIKKEVKLIIETTIGDHWKNTDYCKFTEAKDGTIIVEPKDTIKSN